MLEREKRTESDKSVERSKILREGRRESETRREAGSDSGYRRMCLKVKREMQARKRREKYLEESAREKEKERREKAGKERRKAREIPCLKNRNKMHIRRGTYIKGGRAGVEESDDRDTQEKKGERTETRK